MKPASVLSEGLPVTCRICSLTMSADVHAMRVLGPVEALMPGGTTVEDWRREAQWRATRRGQFADVVIYPDVANNREIEILVARILHHAALSPRIAEVA